MSSAASPPVLATVRVGVVNVSDRAAAGIYEDTPGRLCADLLRRRLRNPVELAYAVVPDGRPLIAAALRRMAGDDGCSLVVTTGGTGPAPRDVTPEATGNVCDRLLPALAKPCGRAACWWCPRPCLRGRPPARAGAA